LWGSNLYFTKSMRKGNNPYKDSELEQTGFSHQVIMPVYIPHLHSYFKDALKILDLSLKSLIKTSHSNTLLTVVNNGSCKEVKNYLDSLWEENKIHEVIHTTNIGKMNAAFKGAVGHKIPLVTITDADVLFLNNWQTETLSIFNNFTKAGVVGLIPQFLSYQYNCENLLFNNFLNRNVHFTKVKKPEALAKFYKSIGWDESYPKERLQFTLCIKKKNIKACIGTGHVVSTFKREVLDQGEFSSNYKMGGDSEANLDSLPSKLGYSSLTTYDNLAFHMGNVWEQWMSKTVESLKVEKDEKLLSFFSIPRKPWKWEWKIKKKIIASIFKRHKLRMLFLKFKGLPKEVVKSF
jgi:hypothetical protein